MVSVDTIVSGPRSARAVLDNKRRTVSPDDRDDGMMDGPAEDGPSAWRVSRITSVDNDLGRVVDVLPGLVWSALPDGRVEFLNRRWREYTGLDLGQPSDAHWQAAIHPGDLPEWLERWRSMSTSEQPWEMELRLRRYDGAYRWFLCRACPQPDASGHVVGWCGVNTDIDDRMRIENDLRAIEVNFSGWVESFPGLMVTMSLTGQVELFSRDVLEYFGKTREELRNWAMTDAVHPDDLPRVVAAFTESVTTGKPYSIEHRCRRADGVYRWFQVRALAVRDRHDQITGWYVVLTDIDDIKRAEHALRESERESRLIVDSIPGLVAAFTPAGELEFVNRQVLEYFGRTLEELKRWGTDGTIHPDDNPRVVELFTRAIASDEPFELELRARRFDGVYGWLQSRGFPLRDMDGRIVRWYNLLIDIDERKRAEEALNRARSELAHVARVTTLSTLTASIAHEVNQPLSGIITNAGTCLRMLDADPPNVDGARETARRTIRDGNRASDVIARLRALFSKKEFTLESFDLTEATREVIALALSDLQRDRITLQSELADDLPPVTGDRVQLQQVILNLLRNASDAMANVDDRPRQLLVRTEREDGDRVRVTVRDAGVGIHSQSIDKLFDAFYTTKKDGMGIGLSVSRSIIESHRGRIWATPNEGPGATFAFSIPCRQNHPAEAGQGDSVGAARRLVADRY
jgi:PAS domain S-box-containing protein